MEECRLWCCRWRGMPLGTDGDSMSKYVMVDAVSQFRMRYVVEVPDNCNEGEYPCSPEQWAMDTVTCEEAKEFSQEHIGETIISAREVLTGEILQQFRKDEPTFGEAWDDKFILEKMVTRLEDQKDVFVE